MSVYVSILSRGKLTCHFKQLGLTDGAPSIAPFSDVNTYKVCLCLMLGARNGSEFGAYVTSGNF